MHTDLTIATTAPDDGASLFKPKAWGCFQTLFLALLYP